MSPKSSAQQSLNPEVSLYDEAVSTIFDNALNSLNWGGLFQATNKPFIIVSANCADGGEIPYIISFLCKLLNNNREKPMRPIVYIGLGHDYERIEQAKRKYQHVQSIMVEFHRCNIANRAELEKALQDRKADLVISSNIAITSKIYQLTRLYSGIEQLLFNMFINIHLPKVLREKGELLLLFKYDKTRQENIINQLSLVCKLDHKLNKGWHVQSFNKGNASFPEELSLGFYFSLQEYTPLNRAIVHMEQHYQQIAKSIGKFMMETVLLAMLPLGFVTGLCSITSGITVYVVAAFMIATLLTILLGLIKPLIKLAIDCLHEDVAINDEQLLSSAYLLSRALSAITPAKQIVLNAITRGFWKPEQHNEDSNGHNEKLSILETPVPEPAQMKKANSAKTLLNKLVKVVPASRIIQPDWQIIANDESVILQMFCCSRQISHTIAHHLRKYGTAKCIDVLAIGNGNFHVIVQQPNIKKLREANSLIIQTDFAAISEVPASIPNFRCA
jgi:hypothetical protein